MDNGVKCWERMFVLGGEHALALEWAIGIVKSRSTES
jgi:hypothetical protein